MAVRKASTRPVISASSWALTVALPPPPPMHPRNAAKAVRNITVKIAHRNLPVIKCGFFIGAFFLDAY